MTSQISCSSSRYLKFCSLLYTNTTRLGKDQLYSLLIKGSFHFKPFAHWMSTSSENGESQETSTSYSHQQYTRKNYEQKRNNCDQNKSSSESKSLVNFINMNHYQRLNIDSSAGIETIKSAYYALSKQYHPDVVGSSDSSSIENFRLVTESYDILSDPGARETYDRELDLYDGRKFDMADNLTRSREQFNGNNPIYRTRDADMIFRYRQEAALAREKQQNPRKFRAGVFKHNVELTRESKVQQLSNIRRRLSMIELSNNGDKDGSEFYKIHLYDTMRRKQSGLEFSDEASSKNYRYDTNFDTEQVPAVLVLGLIAVTLLGMIFFFSNLTGCLDVKLDNFLNNQNDRPGGAKQNTSKQ